MIRKFRITDVKALMRKSTHRYSDRESWTVEAGWIRVTNMASELRK